MPPDHVLEDLTRILGGVERGEHRVDRAGPDRVPALDQLDELVEDEPRLIDAGVVAFERELVPPQPHDDLHPVAERPQDPVVDGCELGGDFVGDRKDLLQRFEV